MYVLVIMLLSLNGDVIEMPPHSDVFDSEEKCLMMGNSIGHQLNNDPRGQYFISCIELN